MEELEIIAIANLEVTNADEYRKYEKGKPRDWKIRNLNEEQTLLADLDIP